MTIPVDMAIATVTIGQFGLLFDIVDLCLLVHDAVCACCSVFSVKMSRFQRVRAEEKSNPANLKLERERRVVTRGARAESQRAREPAQEYEHSAE